jgi:glycolate oxidase
VVIGIGNLPHQGFLMVLKGTYNPVTPAVVEELRRILGDKHVLFADPEKLQPYSHDEVAEPGYAHMPECVVRPSSAAEIAAVMKLANREHIPVTPRGAGSGLSGGAVPVYGGIVLSVERMNKILEIDRANMMVVVEPGVVTNDINARIHSDGLFYAGYPMSLETCFIGGNVAENAGGGKAVKYGVTSRYVSGLELVTPAGEIVELGGKRVKDVTGYDLLHFMVGSEGTLGIFTKITLRLTPLPKAAADLLCLFRTTEDAIAAVPKIMTESGIVPTAIEFMDQACVRASCEYLNETLPWQDAGAMLLITVDASDEKLVEREYDAIGERVLQAGAVEVFVADNATTSERIWKVRRNIAEAFKVFSPHQSLEDVVVPVANIPQMVAGLADLSQTYDCPIPCYGHAGDGNLHATPVMNPAWSLDRWHETLPRILTDLYKLTARLGGTISGEHGIGHKRKEYMPLVCSDTHLSLMRGIKKALDPNNVLNPGKIFDL